MRKLAWLVPALMVLAFAPRARANTYEIFVNITSEEDLYDLYTSGQITETTFNTLVSLYQRGVDLNDANREELYTLPNLTYAEVDGILAYRKDSGVISDPVALVSAGVLSEDKLLAIAPFLIVHDVGASKWAADGVINVPVRYTIDEPSGAPPAAIHGRVTTLRNLTVGGAAVLTRTRVDNVVYDPTRNALAALPPGAKPQLAKLYAEWDGGDWGVIGGSYRAGFGERLTFDNTDQYTPNGFYADDELRRPGDLAKACRESTGELAESPCSGNYQYMSPDFGWSERLLGIAGGIKDVAVSPGVSLQLYGFASHQARSIYQYELYNKATCDDPHNDDQAGCAAPSVYVIDEDNPAAPAASLAFATLPDMYTESLAGGHAALAFGDRAHVGITAYGATVDWLVEGMDLDFQEWSRRPWGGPYGAIGIDGAYGQGRSDVFVEATRSFDSMAGDGGDFAGVIRQVTTLDDQEIEASLRYYGPDFKNPYAGATAAADEKDGVRGRDEIGGRVRYTGRFKKKINVRASADLWKTPEDNPATSIYVRTDVDVDKHFGWGLWGQFDDKDLSAGGRGACFDQPYETGENLEPVPCAGQQYEVIGRVKYSPNKKWQATVQYQHQLLDDQKYMDGFRQDLSGWVILAARPVDRWRFRVRTRYLFEDIQNNEHLEQSVWGYADAIYKINDRTQIEARYDIYYFLDDRENTQLREPQPAQWLWLELESKF